MTAYPCQNCGKKNESRNYCDWNCHVHAALKDGGKITAPNGLPVGCIKADGSMWEHEHGDHPDYKFPVDVEFVGQLRESDFTDYEQITGKKAISDDDVRAMRREYHAVIYSDYSIAVTMYEHCYAMWLLREGRLIGGNLWAKGEWRLAPASVEKILFMKRTA